MLFIHPPSSDDRLAIFQGIFSEPSLALEELEFLVKVSDGWTCADCRSFQTRMNFLKQLSLSEVSVRDVAECPEWRPGIFEDLGRFELFSNAAS